MSIIEDFFREVDDRWTWPAPTRIPLRLIGSTALMLQTAYQRGTKDSDVLETIDLYLEIVANGIPFLPWPPAWRRIDALGDLRHFELSALDVVDVAVSKLKRLNANDLSDIAAMVDLDLVPHHALFDRFRSAVDLFSGDARAEDLPKYVANLHRIERDVFVASETEIELPGWI